MQDKKDEKLLDLQKQIEKLGGGHTMLVANVAKTLVVGGVQGFDSLHLATEWVDIEDEGIAGPHAHRYLYELFKFSRIDVCEVPEWV